MDLLNELASTDIDPALLAQVQALFARQQIKLAEKDFKITALTHELTYYRRIRFGKASEALVGEQRQLFEETVDMTWPPSRRNSNARRRSSASARAPAVRHCLWHCRASNTAMSPHRASAANAAPT